MLTPLWTLTPAGAPPREVRDDPEVAARVRSALRDVDRCLARSAVEARRAVVR